MNKQSLLNPPSGSFTSVKRSHKDSLKLLMNAELQPERFSFQKVPASFHTSSLQRPHCWESEKHLLEEAAQAMLIPAG